MTELREARTDYSDLETRHNALEVHLAIVTAERDAAIAARDEAREELKDMHVRVDIAEWNLARATALEPKREARLAALEAAGEALAEWIEQHSMKLKAGDIVAAWRAVVPTQRGQE